MASERRWVEPDGTVIDLAFVARARLALIEQERELAELAERSEFAVRPDRPALIRQIQSQYVRIAASLDRIEESLERRDDDA